MPAHEPSRRALVVVRVAARPSVPGHSIADTRLAGRAPDSGAAHHVCYDPPMNWAAFATIFSSVFVAELGDKTQLSTLLFASDARHSRWMVFLAASAALVLTSALGVLAGAVLGKSISPAVLRWVSGLGFIAIGVYTLARGD